MRLDTVIVIIRHNTELAGDVRLACREFDALLGAEGAAISSRRALNGHLGEWGLAQRLLLSKRASVVAVKWHGVESHSIDRLARCSAFAQEILVLHESAAAQAAFVKKCASPHCIANTLGGFLTVVLAWNYIIESEGVLDAPAARQRIQTTVDLLLEPFLHSDCSKSSLRLRNAKKTTLSLTHDLHIYKAKFFPRMVRALLNLFPKEGGPIVDPFCGSGTALLEASLLGLESYGVDIDPICQLISRAKVEPFLSPVKTLSAIKAFEKALAASPKPPKTYKFPEELSRMLDRRDRLDGTRYAEEIRRDAAVVCGALHQVRARGPAKDLLRVLASDAVTKKIRYRFVGVGNGRYTIEVVKQPIVDRLREKLARCRELCGVFEELQTKFGFQFGRVTVKDGDSRSYGTWGVPGPAEIVITSPPYLPASSGREHYTASRALAFAVLGFQAGRGGYYNAQHDGENSDFDLSSFPEAQRLMDYLMSDKSENADPQRDAMRFERKAIPTRKYLSDMRQFFEQAHSALSQRGHLLTVVANQHTFYSHRRQELEHVAQCRELYSEIAGDAGLLFEEEIKVELLKSAVSKARPRATDDYFEAILISRPQLRRHGANKARARHSNGVELSAAE